MSQTTSAYHNHFSAWIEQRCGLLDCVIGSNARISQRGNIFGGYAGIELDNGTCAGFQECCHTTIGIHTWKGCMSTMHIVTCPAGATKAARDLRMDNHGIPDRDVADGG